MGELYEKYTEFVENGFDCILNQFGLIEKAGLELAERKVKGWRYSFYDKGYAMSLDTWTRGSNPCDNYIYKFTAREYIKGSGRAVMLEFEDNDTLIMGSFFADDPEDIAVAEDLKKKKNTFLITITPHKKPDKQRTSKLLHEYADIAIDNSGDNTGGAFSIKGVLKPILPASREITLAINQAIAAEYTRRMVEKGCPPTQFYMVNYPLWREIQDIMDKRIAKYGY